MAITSSTKVLRAAPSGASTTAPVERKIVGAHVDVHDDGARSNEDHDTAVPGLTSASSMLLDKEGQQCTSLNETFDFLIIRPSKFQAAVVCETLEI